MNIERKILSPLAGVYSVSALRGGGRTRVIAASETPGGSCLLLDPEGGEPTTVWKGPGGTMSIVPASPERILAVQQFYAGFDAARSIVAEAVAAPGSDTWTVREQLKLPFLHRLAGVTPGPNPTLLACTLCASKANVDDWSKPGAVYRIETDPLSPDAWQPKTVIERIHRNHGFSNTTIDGERVALVSGMEGLFAITLPGDRGKAWSYSQLLTTDVSDAAAVDWDGDGTEEIVTIEPFHGHRYVFYKRAKNGAWQIIHEMPCLLGHSLWAGEVLGRKALILGERMGEGRIQIVFPTAGSPSEWEVLIVDRATGGTNVTVLQATDRLLEFVSANNDNNQVVLYRIT